MKPAPIRFRAHLCRLFNFREEVLALAKYATVLQMTLTFSTSKQVALLACQCGVEIVPANSWLSERNKSFGFGVLIYER